MDSNTTTTPIVSKELTARTSSASVILTAFRYSRPTTPASSCDRHVRIAAYETAGRPSGVHQSAAESSSSIAAARLSQVCLRRVLCSLTHTARRRLSRNLPPASNAARRAGALAGWLAEGGEEERQASEGSHRRWWCLSSAPHTSSSLISLLFPSDIPQHASRTTALTDGGCPHAGCLLLARPSHLLQSLMPA